MSASTVFLSARWLGVSLATDYHSAQPPQEPGSVVPFTGNSVQAEPVFLGKRRRPG